MTDTEPTNNGQGDNQNTGYHPAYDEYLKDIPESLHALVIPAFKEWDKGVQKKLEDVRSQYTPYEKLIEHNVPFEAIEEGLAILQALNDDPSDVASQLIEQYGLDFVEKSMLEELQRQQVSNNTDSEGSPDLTEDPRFKALEDTVNKFQSTLEKQTEAQIKAQNQERYEKEMSQLREKFGEFDDLAVTAFMSSGMNGEQAVKRYLDIVNQAAEKIAAGNNGNVVDEPPVVMGGDGVSGSGTGQNLVEFGKLKNSEINALVAEMVSKSNQG